MPAGFVVAWSTSNVALRLRLRGGLRLRRADEHFEQPLGQRCLGSGLAGDDFEEPYGEIGTAMTVMPQRPSGSSRWRTILSGRADRARTQDNVCMELMFA
jgi:hypothetical protein